VSALHRCSEDGEPPWQAVPRFLTGGVASWDAATTDPLTNAATSENPAEDAQTGFEW
jgi:hypothetical protein